MVSCDSSDFTCAAFSPRSSTRPRSASWRWAQRRKVLKPRRGSRSLAWERRKPSTVEPRGMCAGDRPLALMYCCGLVCSSCGNDPPATPAAGSTKKRDSAASASPARRLCDAPPCSTPPPRPGLRIGTHQHHLTDCVLANARGPSRRSDAARRTFPTAATTIQNAAAFMEEKSAETVET